MKTVEELTAEYVDTQDLYAAVATFKNANVAYETSIKMFAIGKQNQAQLDKSEARYNEALANLYVALEKSKFVKSIVAAEIIKRVHITTPKKIEPIVHKWWKLW